MIAMSDASKIAIVIPARMASTRFPGKPLCDLGGKPMVQWVFEAAQRADICKDIIIATPDQEIYDVAKSFGAQVMITRADHPSGTDRLAEVASTIEADIWVNVQGDEPLIPESTIRSVATPLIQDASIQMGSCFAWAQQDEEDNPAVVKVVTDQQGFALYFSRYAIPYPRNERRVALKKHVGIYAFRDEALKAFAGWSPTPLEQTESLEQLRFIENGIRIKMSEGAGSVIAVDTPEQAEEVRARLRDLA